MCKGVKRFTTKLQLMVSQVTNDIKFEDTLEMNKTRINDMMVTLQNDNTNVSLMSELKQSMDGEESITINVDEIPQKMDSTEDEPGVL